MSDKKQPASGFKHKIQEALLKVVTDIPSSKEAAAEDPFVRAHEAIRIASVKAGGVSAALALPAGPLALVTLIPDLITVWKIQAQLVSDIAHIFGREGQLNRDTMVYCLFRHAQSPLQDLVVRVGERYAVRRTTQAGFQGLLEQLGLRIVGRFLGKNFQRWIPLIGAAMIARYSYKDTLKVGTTALELFRHELKDVHEDLTTT